MTQDQHGAGLPYWSLSAQNYTVAYGRAPFMSETGKAATSGWFGPLAPLAPIAPKDVAGRAFDFPSGYNIATKPRSYEPIAVEDLRALAETYDLLRIVIETRKDQVERLPWSLRVKAGRTGPGAARRRAKFVPGGVAKTFIQTKEPELKGVFDEWLARIVCYAFSVSPQAFVAQVNRSTGKTHKEMAEEEGLSPILNWVKRLIDRILVEDFGDHDVELVFGQDERIDPSEQAQILTGYVNAGILTRNEARMRLGLAPVEDTVANELTVTTGAGATPVATGLAQNFVKYDPNQPRDERGRWTTEAGGAAPARTLDARVKTAPQSAQTPIPSAAALAFSDPENPHNPARMIGNALDAILDALDRHKARSEPPPVPSKKPQEEEPKDRGATESSRMPRFEGDNLGPPLEGQPKDKPPAPPIPPNTDSREKASSQPSSKEGESEARPKPVEGALPNAENAIIDPNRVFSYTLNPDNPKGGPKAKLLDSVLGFNRSNGYEPIAKIRQGLHDNPGTQLETDKYGTRFRVDIPMEGPNGRLETVRTGWIIDVGSTTPRLLTAYVRRRKRLK